jgi:hypothetical protein
MTRRIGIMLMLAAGVVGVPVWAQQASTTAPAAATAAAPAAQSSAAAAASSAAPGTTVPAADAKKIVQQMHEANYSLAKHGFGSAHCSVAVNWDDIYKQLNANNDDSQQLLALLEKSRFKVVIGPEGSTSISVDSEEAPPSENIAERMRQSQAGIQQTITGLFNTWAGFMVRSMIPEPDETYELKSSDAGYLLTFSGDGANITINTDPKLKIGHVEFKSEKLNGNFDPTFDSTPEGYVLTGYRATFTAAQGQASELVMALTNQKVEGLELPQQVTAKIPYNDTKLNMVFTFSDYQVTKH